MPGSGSKGYQDAARESSARVRSAWTMGVEREALPTIRRMRREGATLHAIADALDARHCPPGRGARLRAGTRWPCCGSPAGTGFDVIRECLHGADTRISVLARIFISDRFYWCRWADSNRRPTDYESKPLMLSDRHVSCVSLKPHV